MQIQVSIIITKKTHQNHELSRVGRQIKQEWIRTVLKEQSFTPPRQKEADASTLSGVVNDKTLRILKR